ncbi:MAG: hypothetical protein ABGY75_08485, partial [Gemmataceae bacterium]
GPKGKSGGGRRWAVAALVVAALAGGIAALFVIPRPQKDPLILALPVCEYKHPDWPPNPWAEADARRLRDRFSADSAQAFQAQEKEPLLRELAAAVQTAGQAARPLVVHLSALGTVHAGTPYLLPADAAPDRPATWLTLDDVLRPLVSATSPRLLVLDVRPCFDPRVNLPTADVGEEVDAALARKVEAGELPFPVLHAHTPPEGPAADHAQRGTAFGLALARGIGGAADGWLPDRTTDQNVSAMELVAFVRDATFAATEPFGGTRQLPRLHGPGGDFTLVAVRSPKLPQTTEEPAPAPAPYPDWLAAAWKDRDDAVAAGLHLRAPRLVRHHILAALRAERAFLAGGDPARLKGQFGGKLTELKAAMPKLGQYPPAAHSLAAARRVDGFEPKVKAAAAALRPVFGLVRSPEFARTEPMAAAAAVKSELTKAKLPPELPPVAVAVWDELLKEPSLDRVKAFAPLVDALGLKPPPAEFAGIQLILAARPERMSRLEPDAVRAVLEAFAAGERAAVGDGRTFELVRDGLKGLDAERRKELVTLFDPAVGFDQMAPAAGRLAGLCKQYESLPPRVEKSAEVEQARDEARAALADLADHFPHELASAAGSGECSLKDLADAYRQAEGLLRSAADPIKLGSAARRLNDSRERLLPKPAAAITGTPRQMEAALLWPGWKADERAALVGKIQAVTIAAGTANPLTVAPNPPTARSPAVFAVSLLVVRNQAEVLALARPELGDRFRETANVFDPRAANAAQKLSDLATEVRAERRGGLKKLYDGEHARRGKVGWAVDPDDVPAGAATADANPDWFDRQLAEREFRRRLAVDRYQADAKAFAPLASTAAETCRQAAEALTD